MGKVTRDDVVNALRMTERCRTTKGKFIYMDSEQGAGSNTLCPLTVTPQIDGEGMLVRGQQNDIHTNNQLVRHFEPR